uniref:Fungal-type protein kinase domain-containing protein n=1 Tax=Ganoderma boninense TaxID=34458 RepID=A0A5K1JWV8_9APHY|nr:Uncharacterized protein [Ganoderma boninense]
MPCPAVELESHEFLDAFLNTPSGSIRKSRRTLNFFKKLKNADTMRGAEVATHLVDAINEYELSAPLLTSTYTRDSFLGSRSTRDTAVGIFRSRDIRRGQPPHWADAMIPVEFARYVEGADPFGEGNYSDKYGDLEWRRKQLLKRVTATAEHVCATQHRVSLFILLVIGRRFRVLRFDRAGIIVTPSVDYYDHPDALCDFFRRAARLDDTSLGFDPTASHILPNSIDYLRMDIAALEDSQDVDHEERSLSENEIIVGPVVFNLSRQWRDGAWDSRLCRVRLSDSAFCVAQGRLASYIISDTEGDVLERLNAANVSNVPTLVCHGDMGVQTTVTADWWERKHATISSRLAIPLGSPSSSSSHTLTASTSPSGRKRKIQESSEDHDDDVTSSGRHRSPEATMRSDCPLRQHTHYRIAVEEVCMPLKSFKCGKQLVSLLFDSLQAHHEAATNPKAGLLHRDISGGNILIYPKVRCRKAGKKPSLVWTGLLCDWELAKTVDDQSTPSRSSQVGRMGTYQFMSVNLLSNLANPVQIADELESFFHVLIYYAVRYLNSNCDAIDSFIQGYFHNYAGPQRLYGCGQKSVLMEITGKLQTEIPYGPLLFDSPMDNLIAFTLECFRSRYKILEHAARADVQPVSEAALPPTAATPCSAQAASLPLPPPPPHTSTSKSTRVDADDDDDVIDWDTPLKHDAPTPEDDERAQKIADHTFMLGIFATALRQRLWTPNDRVAAADRRRSRRGRGAIGVQVRVGARAHRPANANQLQLQQQAAADCRPSGCDSSDGRARGLGPQPASISPASSASRVDAPYADPHP